LFDFGCGATLINHSFIGKLKRTKENKTMWKIRSGSYTDKKNKIKFSLPAFHEHRKICWNCYVDDTDPEFCNYDLMIERDLMNELGIDISFFSNTEVIWDSASIPMQEVDKLNEHFVNHFEQELLFVHEPVTTGAAKIQNIVEGKCCPADLLSIVKEYKLLNEKNKNNYMNY